MDGVVVSIGDVIHEKVQIRAVLGTERSNGSQNGAVNSSHLTIRVRVISIGEGLLDADELA